MINLRERMLPTSAGVEPATSWSPVGRRIQPSHRGRLSAMFYKEDKFGEFLFGILHTNPLLKNGLLDTERICL